MVGNHKTCTDQEDSGTLVMEEHSLERYSVVNRVGLWKKFTVMGGQPLTDNDFYM
jgi:hypothetical protein